MGVLVSNANIRLTGLKLNCLHVAQTVRILGLELSNLAGLGESGAARDGISSSYSGK
jgi:hypothetical protein